MLRASIFISGLFLSACATSPALAQSDDISGVWVNERGSAVSFIETDGRLSGHYNTQLGDPDPDSRFPLTGFLEGDQVTFTVNFKGFGSLTSWTGQISKDADGPYLRTLWHLTRDVPDAEEEDDLWSSIIAGSATFRPVSDN